MKSTEQLSEQSTAQSFIARYDKYFDLRTFSHTLRKTSKPVKKRSSKKASPLVVIRLIDEKGRYDSTTVEIKSAALCEALVKINEDVEDLELTRNPPVADPKLFYHSRTGLEERLEEEKSKDSPDSSLISDLETALQYIKEDHGNNIAEFEKLTDHQEITFDLLWALFPPTTLVYHYHHMTEQVQVLLARGLSYRRKHDGSISALISCDVISNDGDAFGLARDTLEIGTFTGAQKIQDLTVYPLKYHRDQHAIRDHAVSRGKRFVTMAQRSYNEVNGPAMPAFRIFEPDCSFNLRVRRRLERNGLTDELYMICTPIVLGFCFGVKLWGGFAMDRLKDIIWTDEPFRLLVLSAKQKKLIHSLVKPHIVRSTRFDDVIQGKGLGLVGLFSGSPGCGKTLTAEAVAETTRRPLYVVSAGDLGTDPSDLDRNLTTILELAQMWNAVLLIDEAEVFLQRRSVADVKRNALVSIFLRQIEYYQGILMLTTNMLAQCDAAFESRIHFSIHYPDLNFESRKTIWRTFLGKVDNVVTKISDEELDRLSAHEINGRQIKNVVSSAQCIALENNAPLSVEHVETVLEVTHWKPRISE